MTTTTERSLDERYAAFLDRVRDLGGAGLWREADDLYNDMRAEAARDGLRHLVIGFYEPATFPAVHDAVRVTGVEPVTIDECDHRATVSMGRSEVFAGTKFAPALDLIARASLERDLGDVDEARRLEAEAERMAHAAT